MIASPDTATHRTQGASHAAGSGRAAASACPVVIVLGEHEGGTSPDRGSRATPSPTGAQALCSLHRVLWVPKAVTHTSPLPTPRHLPAAPHCTYRPSLEAGVWCWLPALGCLDCLLSVTLVAALAHFNPPSQQAGQGKRDTKRDVTDGVGTSLPPVSPFLQDAGGCARRVAP